MTDKELWKLKKGDIVEDKYIGIGTVIARQVYNESMGFIISKNKTTDLLTGRKFVEITVRYQPTQLLSGKVIHDDRYYQSNKPHKCSHLTKIT